MSIRVQIVVGRLILAFLPVFVCGAIYLNWDQGFLVWVIPTIFYVNILTLLYFAIHFDSIVARLLNVIG
jgi:hypothetical protein